MPGGLVQALLRVASFSFLLRFCSFSSGQPLVPVADPAELQVFQDK
jgi:hypothetical protein